MKKEKGKIVKEKMKDKKKKKTSGEVMGCIVEWRHNYTDIMTCYCQYDDEDECLVKNPKWRKNDYVLKISALVKPSSKKELVDVEVKGCANLRVLSDFHISTQYCPDPYCKDYREGIKKAKDCYYDSKYEPGNRYAIVEIWSNQKA